MTWDELKAACILFIRATHPAFDRQRPYEPTWEELITS